MSHPGDVVRHDARWAGQVRRYATYPTLVPQTNGEHTWQVLRILTTIWPSVPSDVMIHALHHDSGELGSGDIPYPHKAQTPELKRIMDDLERQSLRDQQLVLPQIDAVWRWRIKICDLIEMLEKGMQEVTMGNRLGIPIIRGMEQEIDGMIMSRPPEESVPVVAYLLRRWAVYVETESMS